MSEIKVNKISPATGTETTLGDSSDDFLLPSGAEIIAQSGSTITIASGATLANAGTATGFGGGGKLVQQVTNHTNALVSGTTELPQDTTIPQNTEGNALFELAITPTSATNRLRIQVLVQWAAGADGQIGGIALFQDTTADALNCGWDFMHSGNQNAIILMDYEMAAGTTSATTFKVRGGRSPGGQFYMNRSLYLWMGSPPRMYSNITIQEIDPS